MSSLQEDSINELVKYVIFVLNFPFVQIRRLSRTTRASVLIFLFLVLCVLIKHARDVFVEDNEPVRLDSNTNVDHFLYDPKGKYITLLFHSCGGLANILYRYASIYGIGKKLGRIPFIDQRRSCWQEHMPELAAGLPAFSEQILLLVRFLTMGQDKKVKVDTPRSVRYNWGRHCCKFDDIKKLKADNPEIRFLQVTGNILQSYKYFHEFKPEIRRLMTFSDGVKQLVETYAKTMFRNDEKSHKLCVHTRLGDFTNHSFLQESRLEFINPALVLLGRELKAKYKHVSVVLMGESYEFLKQIDTSEMYFKKRHYLRNLNRMEEIHFGSSKCDSLLISASGSTFGWWIGYLKSDKTQNHVYYNIKISKEANWEKDEFDFDAFPAEWQRLRLTRNGAVVHEKRWHYELVRDGVEIL